MDLTEEERAALRADQWRLTEILWAAEMTKVPEEISPEARKMAVLRAFARAYLDTTQLLGQMSRMSVEVTDASGASVYLYYKPGFGWVSDDEPRPSPEEPDGSGGSVLRFPG